MREVREGARKRRSGDTGRKGGSKREGVREVREGARKRRSGDRKKGRE